MAKTFHLTIAKVGENLFEGEALSATFPGSEGNFTIMAEHEAFVTPLRKGVAKVRAGDGKELAFDIESGIAEISRNQATILL